jgi:hypothetical protein
MKTPGCGGEMWKPVYGAETIEAEKNSLAAGRSRRRALLLSPLRFASRCPRALLQLRRSLLLDRATLPGQSGSRQRSLGPRESLARNQAEWAAADRRDAEGPRTKGKRPASLPPSRDFTGGRKVRRFDCSPRRSARNAIPDSPAAARSLSLLASALLSFL